VKAQEGGHGRGNIGSEFLNLRVDISEIGVARPATQLLDDVMVIASKFEVHGPTGTQAVGADPGKGVTSGHQVVPHGTHADEAADGGGRDLGGGGGNSVVSANRGKWWKCMDFVHKVGQGGDRTEDGIPRAAVVDRGILVTILLVGKTNGNSISSTKDMKGAMVGESLALVPKGDVLAPERDGTSGLGGGSVLTNAKEKKEGNHNEMGSTTERLGTREEVRGNPAYSRVGESVLGLGSWISVPPLAECGLENRI